MGLVSRPGGRLTAVWASLGHGSFALLGACETHSVGAVPPAIGVWAQFVRGSPAVVAGGPLGGLAEDAKVSGGPAKGVITDGVASRAE